MNESNVESEILVVVSKLKSYIRSKAGMSTAGSVAARLSDEVRRLCDRAPTDQRPQVNLVPGQQRPRFLDLRTAQFPQSNIKRDATTLKES